MLEQSTDFSCHIQVINRRLLMAVAIRRTSNSFPTFHPTRHINWTELWSDPSDVVSQRSGLAGQDHFHRSIPWHWRCWLLGDSESRSLRTKVSIWFIFLTANINTMYCFRSCSRRGEFKSDCVMGVMGIDFTLGYFHKLLMDSMEVCGQEHITCFIMDDRGYLVAHPGLVEPAGRGPVEYTHIIHKEP